MAFSVLWLFLFRGSISSSFFVPLSSLSILPTQFLSITVSLELEAALLKAKKKSYFAIRKASFVNCVSASLCKSFRIEGYNILCSLS